MQCLSLVLLLVVMVLLVQMLLLARRGSATRLDKRVASIWHGGRRRAVAPLFGTAGGGGAAAAGADAAAGAARLSDLTRCARRGNLTRRAASRAAAVAARRWRWRLVAVVDFEFISWSSTGTGGFNREAGGSTWRRRTVGHRGDQYRPEGEAGQIRMVFTPVGGTEASWTLSSTLAPEGRVVLTT